MGNLQRNEHASTNVCSAYICGLAGVVSPQSRINPERTRTARSSKGTRNRSQLYGKGSGKTGRYQEEARRTSRKAYCQGRLGQNEANQRHQPPTEQFLIQPLPTSCT